MTQAAPDLPCRKPAVSSRRPYPVLTLRQTLIFPLTTCPLAVGRKASLRARLRHAVRAPDSTSDRRRQKR